MKELAVVTLFVLSMALRNLQSCSIRSYRAHYVPSQTQPRYPYVPSQLAPFLSVPHGTESWIPAWLPSFAPS